MASQGRSTQPDPYTDGDVAGPSKNRHPYFFPHSHMSDLVTIGRGETEVTLHDTIGGKVKLYTSLIAGQEIELSAKYGTESGQTAMEERVIDMIVCNFISWNIGKDGVALPCNPETLKQFTQRDIMAMLQGCTRLRLLDEQGNMLSKEEIAKKAESA